MIALAISLNINEVPLFTSNIRNLVHLESIMIARETNCKKCCFYTYQRLDFLNASQEIRITLVPAVLTIGHKHYEYFIDVWVFFNYFTNLVKNRDKISAPCAFESFYFLPVLSVSGCRKDTLDCVVKCDRDKLLKRVLFLIIKLFAKL